MIFNIKNIFKNGEEKESTRSVKNFREIYTRMLDIDPDNIAFVLKQPNKNKAEAPVYVNVTSKDFYEDIVSLGKVLLDFKKTGKERYGLITNNRYEWPLIYLAVTSGIGSIVPLDYMLSEEELLKSINRIELDYLFYTKKHEKFVEKAIKEKLAPSIKKYILIDNVRTKKEIEEEIKDKENIILLNELIEKGLEKDGDRKEEFLNLPIDVNEECIYSFTSATTSESKIVVLNQKNICANINSAMATFEGVVDEKDRFLSFLSIHHSFESTIGQLTPISMGSKIAYVESLKKLGENIKEYKTTTIIVVPAVLEAIYKKVLNGIKKQGKVKEYALAKATANTLLKLGIDKRRDIFKSILESMGPDLKLIVNGAAALHPAVHKEFTDLGIKVLQGYGLTETSPVVSVSHPKEAVQFGSVGKPVVGVEVRIDEPNSEGIGEIVVKGENVFSKYLNNEEANKRAFTEDGYFKTGDLGYMDKKGNVYISGRIKNVIVLKNGKNVFPEETQRLLDKIPGVLESFVFGYNKENPKNPKIMAKIVYDEDEFKGKTELEIRDILWEEVKKINKKQPQYKYIKEIIVTKEPLIRTTTQKIKIYEEYEKTIKNI